MDRRQTLIGLGAGAAVAAAPRFSAYAQDTTPRIRRDATLMPAGDPFFTKYAEAVKRLHALPAADPANWRNQALVHINHCPHGRDSFFHWHRFYLHWFERACAKAIGDPTFSLAYWNWSNDEGRIPAPFYDVDALNVAYWNDPSNVSAPGWGSVRTVGVRALRKGEGLHRIDTVGVFTKPFIDRVQGTSDFSTYRIQIEGSPHNTGHRLIGARTGHMGSGLSPLDPIFWLHHCNVDRLWAQWQVANRTPALAENYDGQFHDESGAPLTGVTSAGALDVSSLGYTYDTLFSPSVISMAQKLDLPDVSAQARVLMPADVAAAPRTLGTAQGGEARVNQEAAFPVDVKQLLPTLFSQRTFWASDVPGVRRLAAEPGRVIARLKDVTASVAPDSIVVNVYVNCPYLAPSTPSADPNYAGSFAFFGAGGHHGSNEFVVDLSPALRSQAADGRLAGENIKLQLMTVPSVQGGGSDSVVTVGEVAIEQI